MSSYTIELSFLLRGFSDFNEKEGLYASPLSTIENARNNFFKAIGSYPFYVWGDERDLAFKEVFEKSFLEYFYMYEINAQTPDAFYLRLGSFLRRKMPIWTKHWRPILEEMYVTQTNAMDISSVGDTANVDIRTGGSKARTDNHEDSSGKSNTKSVTRAGKSDTPQTELDINLDKIAYASEVQKSDSGSSSDTAGKHDSRTDSGEYNVSGGRSRGKTINDTTTGSKGRGKDVFAIFDQWIQSEYDLFTPLFQEVIREQIFLSIL